MPSIRYLVPYEITVHAVDLASGKAISNNFYYRTNPQTTAAPSYGADIAGSGDEATFLGNFRSVFLSSLITRLNANYKVRDYTMRAILGKRYPSPLLVISSLLPGPPALVSTASAHGLTTGTVVLIQGVTAPALANGFWPVTVLSPFSFQLNGSTFGGVWSGDGVVQSSVGQLEFLFGDLLQTVPASDIGSVVGDALPVFATSSIRRLNNGVGRHFRSRFSMSPMSEVDALDGGFTAAQKALMATALSTFGAQIVNGGSDSTSRFSVPVVISKQLAFGQVSPFAASSPFVREVTAMVQQPNNGSLVRRKPKLTAAII
jgi:hypothetical protein